MLGHEGGQRHHVCDRQQRYAEPPDPERDGPGPTAPEEGGREEHRNEQCRAQDRRVPRRLDGRHDPLHVEADRDEKEAKVADDHPEHGEESEPERHRRRGKDHRARPDGGAAEDKVEKKDGEHGHVARDDTSPQRRAQPLAIAPSHRDIHQDGERDEHHRGLARQERKEERREREARASVAAGQ